MTPTFNLTIDISKANNPDVKPSNVYVVLKGSTWTTAPDPTQDFFLQFGKGGAFVGKLMVDAKAPKSTDYSYTLDFLGAGAGGTCTLTGIPQLQSGRIYLSLGYPMILNAVRTSPLP